MIWRGEVPGIMDEPSGAGGNQRLPGRTIALLSFLLISIAFGVVALLQGWLSPVLIQEAVTSAGPAGWIAFVLAVVVLEVLWMPRSWGLVAAGVLFGPVVGAALALVADMAGALVCFLLGRGGARQWVTGLLERRPKIHRAVTLLAERRGVVAVAILRVVPVAHYTAISYASGVAGVPVAAFLLGNFLGILPYGLLIPFVGHAALDPTSPEFLIGLVVVALCVLLSAIAARRLFRDDDSSPPESR